LAFDLKVVGLTVNTVGLILIQVLKADGVHQGD
jgi:hypothetical protein